MNLYIVFFSLIIVVSQLQTSRAETKCNLSYPDQENPTFLHGKSFHFSKWSESQSLKKTHTYFIKNPKNQSDLDTYKFEVALKAPTNGQLYPQIFPSMTKNGKALNTTLKELPPLFQKNQIVRYYQISTAKINLDDQEPFRVWDLVCESKIEPNLAGTPCSDPGSSISANSLSPISQLPERLQTSNQAVPDSAKFVHPPYYPTDHTEAAPTSPDSEPMDDDSHFSEEDLSENEVSSADPDSESSSETKKPKKVNKTKGARTPKGSLPPTTAYGKYLAQLMKRLLRTNVNSRSKKQPSLRGISKTLGLSYDQALKFYNSALEKTTYPTQRNMPLADAEKLINYYIKTYPGAQDDSELTAFQKKLFAVKAGKESWVIQPLNSALVFSADNSSDSQEEVAPNGRNYPKITSRSEEEADAVVHIIERLKSAWPSSNKVLEEIAIAVGETRPVLHHFLTDYRNRNNRYPRSLRIETVQALVALFQEKYPEEPLPPALLKKLKPQNTSSGTP